MKYALPGIMLSGMLFFFSLSVSSQTAESKKKPLTHHETPEEYANRMKSVKSFIPTEPPVGDVKSIAEFDRSEGALVSYAGGFGIPLSLIRELAKDATVTTLVPSSQVQQSVINQYTQNRINLDNCEFMIIPTNSYWTRDYGPMYISYGTNQIGIVDFPYNRDRPNDDDAVRAIATQLGLEWFGMEVIHTGGNYMTDGFGMASSTTIVYEENPGISNSEVDQRMEDYLGIYDYSVLEDPNNTYIDHIDCWGKYLAPDKVLIRSVPASHPQYDEIEATADYYENKVSAYGTPYKVYRVYTPQNQPYTNSLILNDKVFVPIMNSQYDEQALQTYRDAMPGYKVLGFIGASATPWESTDALHCRVHEMADRGWLSVRHVPKQGDVPVDDTYNFVAHVKPHSGEAVKNDSIILYYRINPNPVTPYTALGMNNTMGSSWSANISSPEEGSTIEYYIFAADESGRREYSPFIGPADAYKFFVGSQMNAQVSVSPSSLNFTAMKDTEETKVITINSTGQIGLNYTLVPTTSVNDTATYTVNNSPSPTSYNSNTLTESGWTSLSVNEQANVSNLILTYQWDTDNYYAEGSLWIQSPDGTSFRAGYQQMDGFYKVECPVFAGHPMNGTWKIWIQDSYGDGGHQATNVSLKIVKENPVGNWLTVSTPNGNIAAGLSNEVQITASGQGMTLGTYEAYLTLYSNDPAQSAIVIPVNFEVTVNTSVAETILEKSIEVNPNPFNDILVVKFNLPFKEDITIDIYNSSGVIVYTTNHSVPNGLNRLNLPVSNLSVGSYIMKISDKTESVTFKLFKSN